MKLTKTQLKQIIKEEISKALNEDATDVPKTIAGQTPWIYQQEKYDDDQARDAIEIRRTINALLAKGGEVEQGIVSTRDILKDATGVKKARFEKKVADINDFREGIFEVDDIELVHDYIHTIGSILEEFAELEYYPEWYNPDTWQELEYVFRRYREQVDPGSTRGSGFAKGEYYDIQEFADHIMDGYEFRGRRGSYTANYLKDLIASYNEYVMKIRESPRSPKKWGENKHDNYMVLEYAFNDDYGNDSFDNMNPFEESQYEGNYPGFVTELVDEIDEDAGRMLRAIIGSDKEYEFYDIIIKILQQEQLPSDPKDGSMGYVGYQLTEMIKQELTKLLKEKTK